MFLYGSVIEHLESNSVGTRVQMNIIRTETPIKGTLTLLPWSSVSSNAIPLIPVRPAYRVTIRTATPAFTGATCMFTPAAVTEKANLEVVDPKLLWSHGPQPSENEFTLDTFSPRTI